MDDVDFVVVFDCVIVFVFLSFVEGFGLLFFEVFLLGIFVVYFDDLVLVENVVGVGMLVICVDVECYLDWFVEVFNVVFGDDEFV